GCRSDGCGFGAVVVVCACYTCGSLVFFFQAEDGIRDWSVTGVQTCALPISALRLARGRRRPLRRGNVDRFIGSRELDEPAVTLRSEERRVGKEGRDWGGGVC